MTENPKSNGGSTKSELKLINEKCWILVGRQQNTIVLARKIQPSEGAPTTVEFDAAWLIDREEQRGDIVGFLHTHPSGLMRPSQKDIDTMQAWTSCFGRSLYCLIQADDEVVAFEFVDDECKGQPVAGCEVFADDHLNEEFVVLIKPQE